MNISISPEDEELFIEYCHSRHKECDIMECAIYDALRLYFDNKTNVDTVIEAFIYEGGSFSEWEKYKQDNQSV